MQTNRKGEKEECWSKRSKEQMFWAPTQTAGRCCRLGDFKIIGIIDKTKEEPRFDVLRNEKRKIN